MNLIHPLIPLSFLLAACSSNPSTDSQEMNEYRTENGGKTVQSKPAKVEDWAAARSDILRTFAFRALEKNLIEEGRNYLQEACDLDPMDTGSHATLARLFLTEDNARSSLAYSERAIEMSPGNLDLSLVYAAALVETDQVELATAELEKYTDWETIAATPELARAMLLHYASTGGLDDAHEFLEKMTEHMPDSPYTWAMIGDLFLASGDVRNAAEAYMQALERDPSIPTPRVVSEELGLENTPGADPVLVAAMKAEDAEDLAGAERLYRFLIRSQGENSDVHAGLARVLWRQARYAEAMQLTAAMDPSLFTWREHMLVAKIAIGMKDWETARASLTLAQQDRPGLKAAELLLAHVRQEMTR